MLMSSCAFCNSMPCVNLAIFFGCPSHLRVLPEAAERVLSLHVNGSEDSLTPEKKAREHAKAFGKDTFVNSENVFV